MATAKKLPSGSYRCLAYDGMVDGKRKYKSFTALTKKEAEYAAAAYLNDMAQSKKSGANITFGKALDKYIEERKDILSPRSIANYKRIRNNDIQGIMDIPICDITQELIQNVINTDAITHSPKTVRDNHGLISAVLRQNRPDFALNTTLPKKKKPNLYIPTDADVKRLMELVNGTELEIPVLLSAFGPMRRGEICALTKENIDGNTVHVYRNMVINEDKTWIIRQPKSYAGDRYITYPDFVINKIRYHEDNRVTNLNPDELTCRFARLIKSSGLPHFRFHDLRHYSASIQHAIGIPDAYIMQRGGWGSDGVLKEVYRHVMSDKENEMNTKANSYFDTLCNTKCNTK